MAFFNKLIDGNGSLFPLYIILLIVGHSQKSAGVISGEYGGQEMEKCFPTTLSPKYCSSRARVDLAV